MTETDAPPEAVTDL